MINSANDCFHSQEKSDMIAVINSRPPYIDGENLHSGFKVSPSISFRHKHMTETVGISMLWTFLHVAGQVGHQRCKDQ